MWRAQFNGDPSVIGTTIRLSARAVRRGGHRAPGLPGSDCAEPSTPGGRTISRDDTLSENNSLAVLRPAADGRQPRAGASGARSRSASRRSERWPDAQASSIVAVPLQRRRRPRLRATSLHLLVDRRRPRAAGRLCQRRQSRPRARDRPGPGVRDPRGARLRPRPAGATTPDRKPGPRRIRRPRRARAGGGRRECPPVARPRCVAAARRCRLRSCRAGVRRSGHDGDGPRLWRDAGAAPCADRSESRARAAVALVDRHSRGRADCEAASPPPARPRAGAPRRRRRAADELLSTDASRPRLPRRSRAHVRGESADRSLRRRPARRLSGGAGAAARGDPRRDRGWRDVSSAGDRAAITRGTLFIDTGPLAGTRISRSRGSLQQRTVSGDFFKALDHSASRRAHLRRSR